ncbi:MAG: hypothetical protein ACFB21_07055 [Opitutales bacterium]
MPLTFAEAVNIFGEIAANADRQVLGGLLQHAVRYARSRTDYRLAAPSEQQLMGADRTRLHNRLLDAVDELSADMHRRGASTEWRSRLGDDRKQIGDFACYLHAIIGINAR